MFFNSEGKLNWSLFWIILNICDCLWFINFRFNTFYSFNSKSNRSEILFLSNISINFDLISFFLFCLLILFKWRNIISVDFNVIISFICAQWSNRLILLLCGWESIISVSLVDLVHFVLLNLGNRRWFDYICIVDREVRRVCFHLWDSRILIHLCLNWRFLNVGKIIKLWIWLNGWLIRLSWRLIRW